MHFLSQADKLLVSTQAQKCEYVFEIFSWCFCSCCVLACAKKAEKAHFGGSTSHTARHKPPSGCSPQQRANSVATTASECNPIIGRCMCTPLSAIPLHRTSRTLLLSLTRSPVRRIRQRSIKGSGGGNGGCSNSDSTRRTGLCGDHLWALSQLRRPLSQQAKRHEHQGFADGRGERECTRAHYLFTELRRQ